MISETSTLVLVGISGFLLGTLFFGGLYLTILKGPFAKRPALWFLLSLILRTGIVLIGFYFISGIVWDRWLAAVLGFVMARLVVVRITNPQLLNAGGLCE